jgi:transcriptional regulator with XRE-family HTH domain
MAMLLRNAREKKGLSQRELSTLSGVRQSQISRIEQGAVDLRVTSLIELARALELELTFVPRPAVPAVQSIVRSATPSSGSYRDVRRTLKEVRGLEEILAQNPSALELEPNELGQLQRNLKDMTYFQLSSAERNEIRNTRKIVEDYLSDHKNLAAVQEALARLRKMRNAHAHAIAPKAASGEVRPAYTLDEDDDA